MRRVGLLALLLPACFTIPDYSQAPPDEDSDGIENEVDLCPHINGAEQVDADTDGVGNGCDPNPGAQDLHAFYGFDTSLGDLSATGRVQLNSSFVEIGVTGSDAYNTVEAPLSLSRTEMEIRFFAQNGIDSAGGGIGVRLGRYDAMDDHAGFCIFEVEPNDRVRLTVRYTTPTQTFSETSGEVDIPYRTTSGRMHAVLAGNELSCTVDQLNRPGSVDDDPPISLELAIPELAAPGAPGVFARNAIMTVEYLFVTGVP
jgi:hypothetical protein